MADAKIITYGQQISGGSTVILDNNSSSTIIESTDGKEYVVIDTTDGAEKLTLGNSSADVVSLGPVQVPDGTTSAPGVAFKDQTNTGIIRPSANNLGFVCNGTTRMQISGGGDVLIASGGGLLVAGLKSLGQALEQPSRHGAREPVTCCTPETQQTLIVSL